MLHYLTDYGIYTLDLRILLGGRDLKDIIVVSHSLDAHAFHPAHGIPISEYTGNKKDLMLFPFAKYLKGFRDIIDIRAKIGEDFSNA